MTAEAGACGIWHPDGSSSCACRKELPVQLLQPLDCCPLLLFPMGTSDTAGGSCSVLRETTWLLGQGPRHGDPDDSPSILAVREMGVRRSGWSWWSVSGCAAGADSRDLALLAVGPFGC